MDAWEAPDEAADTVSSGVDAARGPIGSGLSALCGIAAYYRIPADAVGLSRELSLDGHAAPYDIIRAAKLGGLKGRLVADPNPQRLSGMPTPAIVKMRGGGFVVLGGRQASGSYRVVDPVSRIAQTLSLEELFASSAWWMAGWSRRERMRSFCGDRRDYTPACGPCRPIQWRPEQDECTAFVSRTVCDPHQR